MVKETRQGIGHTYKRRKTTVDDATRPQLHDESSEDEEIEKHDLIPSVKKKLNPRPVTCVYDVEDAYIVSSDASEEEESGEEEPRSKKESSALDKRSGKENCEEEVSSETDSEPDSDEDTTPLSIVQIKALGETRSKKFKNDLVESRYASLVHRGFTSEQFINFEYDEECGFHDFAPKNINAYLGLAELTEEEKATAIATEKISMDVVAKYLLGKKNKREKDRNTLPLPPKTAALMILAAYNWFPTAHRGHVATSRARLIYYLAKGLIKSQLPIKDDSSARMVKPKYYYKDKRSGQAAIQKEETKAKVKRFEKKRSKSIQPSSSTDAGASTSKARLPVLFKDQCDVLVRRGRLKL
ncbi:hypothetical protein AALP_AA5G135300 [Arabis alpina]|uniref:Uncharacterized protein n=1 Tax=Arabis alpina TaxID=50452 RepID=A0A087GWV8_ARAAL|nr:hypothetical protein AALP_AA5G135300 [Arabis alpina]